MYRVLCLLFCVSALAYAQTSNAQTSSPPSSAVQVVYEIGGSTLITYNVDPQTLQATEVGSITVTQSTYPGLFTSPNGHFLYYFADQGNYGGEGNQLYVYDTNASGLPDATAVQKLAAALLSGWAVDPNGEFLYTVEEGTSNGETTPFRVVRRMIDQSDGKLSQPVTEAAYRLDTYSSGLDCYLSLLGFNPAGTMLYDGILCSGPHASGKSFYNERSVNSQTGALGPDEQIYAYNEYAGSEYVNVQMVKNLLFTFVEYFNQGPNANAVDVYRIPNTKPAVNCTTSMLTICGDFESGTAHPSGKYVFLYYYDSGEITYIDQVDLSTKSITQTDSIPFTVSQFSPDGTIIYAGSYGTNDIQIYGFSVSSGQATEGGTISQPSNLQTSLAAERY
jgi:hypothetical protein